MFVCTDRCDHCCDSCCSNYVRCTTSHCCHRQCHYECQSFACRTDCRRSCFNSLNNKDSHNGISAAVSGRIRESSQSSNVQNATNLARHNITTVINLKNTINYTNVMDIPISLNYTNNNNISVVEQSKNSRGGNTDGCCTVIGPKQCKITKFSPYLRCFHTRSRQCGSFCTANIVHQETTEICNSFNNLGINQNCKTELTYIPQPEPKCSYTASWPYVSCGIKAPSGMCNGCSGLQTMEGYSSCPSICQQGMNLGAPYGYGSPYQSNFNPYSNICIYFPHLCSALPSFPIVYQVPDIKENNISASAATTASATSDTTTTVPVNPV
ncbi:hypothetical protein GWI33_005389 [Rhynchophorus ferrugineus]|uniref:Uncharacterized protein n=1 Tax=Rhynchophorus ferrugineus TaxID=354439 RepID=A0A834ILR6_RHYFE|nr:hypothetical protein GWI33_005389 [Rhynchophorus ferrugineus]